MDLSIEIPTLNFVDEESLENLASETIETKINSEGPVLDSVCSLIEPTFENVIIESDTESSTIKFIAESNNHLLDVRCVFVMIIYCF